MKLTEADFQRAAKRLKCSVPAIKAVAEVESRGEGFYPDGFPTILFERHKFRSFTKGRYNNSHPHLSGDQGGYGKAGRNQRNKFSEAFALNPEAAMKSCSWGKFQIMGFNHKVCGYDTVGEFVDAMKESEGKHLDAFVAFVIYNGLDKHLRHLNWASFAEGYNGKDYAINRYDKKMAKAYERYLRSSGGDNPTPAILEPTAEPTNAPQPTTAPPEQQVVVVEKEPEVGFWEGIKLKFTGWWGTVGGTEGAKQFAGDAQFLGLTAGTWRYVTYAALAVGAAWFLYYAISYLRKRRESRDLTTTLVKENSTPENLIMVIDPAKIEEYEKQGYVIVRRK